MQSVKMEDLKRQATLEDERTMNIYEKLSCIQCELKAPKNQYNSFGKYNYRNCEDILEGAKPICNKYRTTLTVCDSIKFIEGRYYVEATASLYDWDSDKSILNSAFAREAETKSGMDVSQITGASSSYARKYALNGLFCIDDTKDADTDAYKQQVQKGNEKEIEALTKQWAHNRKRMDALDIDYRSEKINAWICETIKSDNHEACQDVQKMRNINQAYEHLISGALKRIDKQRGASNE